MSKTITFQPQMIRTPQGMVHVRQRTGEKPPIIALHAAGFDGSIMTRMANHAIFDGHGFVALDFPGHGRSGNAHEPETCYTISGLADCVIAVAEELGLTGATLIGWAMGGHVALDALDRSERIAAAATLCTPPLKANAVSALHAYHFSRDLLQMSRSRFDEKQALRFETVALGDHAAGDHVGAIMRVDPRFNPVFGGSLFRGRFIDQYALACSATKPLAVIGAADDPLVHPAFMRAFLDDGGYFGVGRMIGHGGHAPFLDLDSQLYAYLGDFLDIASACQDTGLARAA